MSEIPQITTQLTVTLDVSGLTIAQQLRVEMALAGPTGVRAKEVAEQAGMDEAQLSRYLTGVRVPSLRMVERLRAAIRTCPSPKYRQSNRHIGPGHRPIDKGELSE